MSTRITHTLRIFFIFSVLCAGGITACALTRPQSLSATDSAAVLLARRLQNPLLGAFIRKNILHAPQTWPPHAWTLSELRLAALYYHPALDVARAEWHTAQAAIITAGARPNPSIGFRPEWNATAVAPPSPWVLGLDFSVPIETAGKRKWRIRQARALADSARFALADKAWQVASDVRKAVVNYQTAERTLKIVKTQKNNAEELDRILHNALTETRLSPLTFSRNQITLSTAEITLADAEKDVLTTRVALAHALAIPTDELANVTIATTNLQHAPAFSKTQVNTQAKTQTKNQIKEMRRHALTERSDIAAKFSAYTAAVAAWKLEVAKAYPDLQLGPGYAWDQGQNKWALGFTLTLPLFDQNRGPIAETKSKVEFARADFLKTQNDVLGAFDTAAVDFQSAQKKYQLANELADRTNERVQAGLDLLRGGQNDDIARLMLGQERLKAELVQVTARAEFENAVGEIEDVLQRPLENVFPAAATWESAPGR